MLFCVGCPRPPLPPPPKGAGGKATQALAERDAKIDGVRANAVLRVRIPEGRQGHPGAKLSTIALAAARAPRARLEVLTPIGTPAATLLMADGIFQAYDPFQHVVRKAPLDSPRIAEMVGELPLSLEALPALLRGVVLLETGDVTEVVPEPARKLDGELEKAVIFVEVRRDGRVVQAVSVDAEGGYALEDIRYDETGRAVLTVAYAEYGGVELAKGDWIAFPQKITARAWEPGPDGKAMVERAQVEVRLSGIELNPKIAENAFTLVFDRPPQVEDL